MGHKASTTVGPLRMSTQYRVDPERILARDHVGHVIQTLTRAAVYPNNRRVALGSTRYSIRLAMECVSRSKWVNE